MNLKRVVVTGMGAVTPVGNTIDQFWNSLITGVSGAAPITLFDCSKFKTKFACEIKNLDFSTFIDKKEMRRLDRFSQVAMIAAAEAVQSANIHLDQNQHLNADRIGVIVGSGIGGLITFQEEVREYILGDGTPRYNPFFIPKLILDIAAGHISMKYGYRGPNFAVVSACASSTHAIIDAFNYIRLGKADIILAGGAESVICESGIAGFNAMKALSERNDDYKTASRPFDQTRDGFVMGEGSGILVLEELEHAIKRGANIICEIGGGGATADAHHLTAPHPEGLGASNVMKAALADAEMKHTEIDYVNVHGTSTPLGDVAELKAIENVFGDAAYKMNISSTKSMTGHLLGAAGAVEAIACILAVKHDIVPPTINHTVPDPEINPKLNLTLNKPQKKTINAALSNTFGFGGHNASVIVKKYSA